MQRITELNAHGEWVISLKNTVCILNENENTGYNEITGEIADRLALYEELGKSPQELFVIVEDYENMKRKLEKACNDLETAQNAAAIMKLKYLDDCLLQF